jgi:hypothetical protein
LCDQLISVEERRVSLALIVELTLLWRNLGYVKSEVQTVHGHVVVAANFGDKTNSVFHSLKLEDLLGHHTDSKSEAVSQSCLPRVEGYLDGLCLSGRGKAAFLPAIGIRVTARGSMTVKEERLPINVVEFNSVTAFLNGLMETRCHEFLNLLKFVNVDPTLVPVLHLASAESLPYSPVSFDIRAPPFLQD